jgi:serine/threonine-protein kinase
MTNANARTPRELFLAALEITDAEAQRAWLQQACAGDEALHARLQRMLAADRHNNLHTLRPSVPLLQMMPALDPWQHLGGTQVGVYRIERELGRGGMGAVFGAVRTDGQVEQRVAIKFLRRDLVDASALRRFRLEREVMTHLQHPGIIRLLDAAQLPDGTPYYVMDHVDGAPLLSWCDTQRLHIAARLRLFLAICEAVSAAHRNLIVHRDLKSSNILVDTQGHPHLLDFGIAKALGGHLAALAHEDTATAQRFFSPATAAPEQLRSGPVTVACDVYALGLLLYELLSGLRPFDFVGLSAGQIEERILRSAAPAPSAMVHAPTLVSAEVEALAQRLHARQLESPGQLARLLRGDLDAIVLRCLRKAPGDRYASVEALALDITHYLEGRAVSARNGARLYVLRKNLQRHKWSVTAASVAAAAVLATAAGFAYQAQRIALERDRAEEVTGLLVKAFRSADPGNSLGAEITAREILDRGAREISSDTTATPALRARLMETLAEVNSNLDRHGEARDLLAKAQVILADANVDDDGLHARLAVAQGHNAVTADNAAAAAGFFDEALRHAPSADLRTSIALDRVRLEQNAGRYERGLEQLDAILQGLSPTSPAQRDVLTQARLLRSDLLRLLGRGSDARTDLSATLDWLVTFRPGTHPDVLKARLRLAELERANGQPQKTLEILQRLRDEVTRMYGSATPLLAALHNYEGNALGDLQRYEDAAAAYRQAHDIWSKALGAEHPNIARAAFNLAQALALAGHVDEADTWYRRCLAIAEKAWAGNHPTRVLFARIYADFLVQQKRPAAARAVLDPCLDATLGGDRSLNRGDLLGVSMALSLASDAGDRARAQRYGERLLRELRERNWLDKPEFTAALAAITANGQQLGATQSSQAARTEPLRRPTPGDTAR